jgi:transcriptional regulator with XRE-family HTH domain
MSERSTLGVVIRRRRQELGWTQEELAERISTDDEYVRQSEISRIENGKTELPRRERLVRLAEVLDLPLGELLARSGWAGAEEHFRVDGTRGAEDIAGKVQVGSVRHGYEERREISQPSNPSQPQQPWTSNRGALSALRQAISTMHQESERLSHNRDRSVEILEQIKKSVADTETEQAGDYASLPRG